MCVTRPYRLCSDWLTPVPINTVVLKEGQLLLLLLLLPF
jgi:hypothetical protein